MSDASRRKAHMLLTWKNPFGACAAALVIFACDMQTAGTSVGTGNPTEIEVAFKNDSGSVPITGTMNVYASTQIPVPGFSPAPLLSVPVAGTSYASLNAAAFKALPDSLWPKGSLDSGVYRFNIVVTGQNKGGILTGLGFRKGAADFVVQAGDADFDRSGNLVTVQDAMTPLAAFQGTLDTTTFALGADYFLFLYGTGYASKIVAGRFSIQNLPLSKYDGFLISLPGKDHQSSGIDSVSVFGLTSSLESGTASFSKGSLYERVALPDSLR